MKRSRRRSLVVLAVAAAAVAAYVVRIDGPLRPVRPSVTVALEEASLDTPALYSTRNDVSAVYAVFGWPRTDGRFDAMRVDARTGAQSHAAIAIGPDSGFSPFTGGDVHADVHGLSLRRPMVHLLSYPDGGGPGIHFLDSDTGVVRLIAGQGARRRVLMERWVFNSSTTRELQSQMSTDAGGRIAAVVVRSSAGWTLHLFHKLPEES